MRRRASWGNAVAAAAALIGLLGAGRVCGEPSVVVEPTEVAVGQPFTARVEGAPPGSTVKWRVNANARFLRADSMRREASFEATKVGEAVVTAVVGGKEPKATVRVTERRGAGDGGPGTVVIPVVPVQAPVAGATQLAPKNYEEFAEAVLSRFLKTGQVSERDMLYLMSHPDRFNALVNPWKGMGDKGAELVQRVLTVRQRIIQRVIRMLQSKGGAARTLAVVALGSWSDLLNPNAGDLDAVVKGGRAAVQEFNAALDAEINRLISIEGDDVLRVAMPNGITVTVERLEIFVSTMEDFGYGRLGSLFRDAVKRGGQAGTDLLREGAEGILLENLRAQQLAALNPEVYGGVSGQNFAKRYLQSKGKAWIVSPNGTLRASQGFGNLTDELLRELGMVVEGGSVNAFNFSRIATEYMEWTMRAGRGAREQAKGIERAMQALTPDQVHILQASKDHWETYLAARVLARADRANLAEVAEILEAFGLTPERFSQLGEQLLWDAVGLSNIEAMNRVSDALRRVAELRAKGNPISAEAQNIFATLLGNEQLAGYAKLKPEHLTRLAAEIPEGVQYADEMKALLELMAEGMAKDVDAARKLLVQLIDIARRQGRLGSSAANEATQLARSGKALPAEADAVIAGLRRDLAEVASIHQLGNVPMDEALQVMRQYRQNAPTLILDDETRKLITWLCERSDIELLRIGFRESEIAVLREIARARKAGLNPGALGDAARKGAPKRWGSIVVYVGIGGGIATYQMIKAANDPNSPDEAIADAVYDTFPTFGLIFEGLPTALGEADAGPGWDNWSLEQVRGKKLAGDVAMATMEIVGLYFPVAGAVILTVYVGGTVGLAVMENSDERALVQSLYRAMDENGDFNTSAGKRSFLTLPPPQIEKSEDGRRVRIVHTIAFDAMYGPEGDVVLVDRDNKPLMSGSLRDGVRAYAQRRFWAGNKKLEDWATAIGRHFPDLDLDQVESWRFAEVSEQARAVSGQPFRVGAHMVRRYVHERDLLTEAAIQHLLSRVIEMKRYMANFTKWHDKLAEIELGLVMGGRILPNATSEQNSLSGVVIDTAFTSNTQLERELGIWKRYIKTYGGALDFLNNRVAKVFADAGLEAPSGDVFYGLSGIEAEDAPKIQKVYEEFQGAFLKASKDFKEAKGGSPDMKDAFDADAWGRLLSVSLRLLSPGTEARGEKLRVEREAILEEIRAHYAAGGVSLATKGPDPAQPKVGDVVRFSAEVRREKAGGVPMEVLWLMEDRKTVIERGPSFELTAKREGPAVQWVAAESRPEAPTKPQRLAEAKIPYSVAAKDAGDGQTMPPGDGGPKPPDGGPDKPKPPGGHSGTKGTAGDGKKSGGPRQLRDISGFVITCPEMVKFGDEVRIQMKEPPSGYWGHIDFVWSHGRGGLYGTTFKPEQPGTYEVTIEFIDTTPTWPKTSLGKRSCRVVVPKAAVLTVPKEVMETDIFEAKLDIAPEWAAKVKKYSFSGGEILTGQIEGQSGWWTSTPTIKMQFRPGMMKGNAAEVGVSAGACDAEGKNIDGATAKILLRPVRMSATGGGIWKFAQLEDGISFERQPAIRKRSDKGQMVDSATARGHLSVRWDRFSRDQSEAQLKENVAAAAIWQSLPPAGASEGKIEVVPFAIGDFKGYMKRATTVVTRYNGNPWDYVDVCLPQANTAGSATLLKGKVTLNIYYSTGGSGMGLGTGTLWWDDMPFLKQHAAAADAEVKAMIGSVRLTPEQKIDSAPYTGPPLDGTGMPAALQVAVKATPAEAKFGQSVEVATEVTGGKAPYEYTWTGDHAGKGEKVTFISSKAGEHKLSVAVKDADGATATGEVTIKVVGVDGRISGLPGQVVYGQKVEIRGSVEGVAGAQGIIDKTNAENAKEQAEWDKMIKDGMEAEKKGGGFILPVDEEGPDIQTPQFKFIWHADKEGIAFDPPEGMSTTVLFGRMGPVKIWAQVLDKDGATIGETPQSTVNVVAPKFRIAFDPPTGRVGQEIRARVTTEPMTLDAPVFYRWSVPESSNRMEYNDSAGEIGFKVKEPKPLRVIALVEVPHYRDAIENIDATFTPGAYAVKVIVEESETTKPKVWDPAKGGIKTLPRGTYAGDEQIRLRAEIEGEPKPAEVRWKWAVNEGTTISNEISQTPTVSRHETGSIGATVEARDKDGVLLGTGSINLAVTVPPNQVNPVMVAAKADKATIKSGEKTWLRAEVKGGTAPYTYQWSGAVKGSGQAVEFLGEKGGDATATVAVKDSKGKTGNASVTVKVEPAEIAVSVAASKARIFVGETADLTATAKGGTEPYAFTWAAPAKGQAGKAQFAPDKAGEVEISVDALDKFGNKGTGKVKVAVGELEVTIEGLRDEEIVGATRALQLRTPLSGAVQAVFSADPALAFAPATAPQGKASVTFDKAGSYRVRAEAQVKRDNAWVTVGRSKDYPVSVVAPKMEVAFEPAEASVGQPVKAMLKMEPTLATGTFDVAWKGLPGGAPAKGAQVAFKPANVKPIEAVATVKAMPGGTAIGEAKGTFTAKPLEVKIEATASAGTRVWDAGRGELVDLPKGKFAAGAAIGLTASLPDGFQGAAFAWTAKGGSIVGSASGEAIKVTAQEKGVCEVEAVAKDRDGAEIGKGAIKLDIAVSQAEIDKMKAEAQAQKLVEAGYALEQAGNLPGAIEKYEAALALVPDEKLSARIAALREKLAGAGGMTGSATAGVAPGGTNAPGEGAMPPGTTGGQVSPPDSGVSAGGQTSPPDSGVTAGGSDAGGRIPVTVPPNIVKPVHTTGNVGGVQNGPTAPTLFKTDEPYVVTLVRTYHWNNGRGQTPGTIALRHSDGTTYGPWKTSGTDGQGGVKNAYWNCEPNVLLKPGTYTVIDSDPGTWAQNAQAGGSGFVEIKGATKRIVEEATGVKLPATPGEVTTGGSTTPPTSPITTPPMEDVRPDGSYAGRFEGGAGGDIRFTVAAGRVNGTISGSYQGSRIVGEFTGTVDASGNIITVLTGKFISETQPYPFTGKILGTLRAGSGTGTWDAQNQWGKPQGGWRANRGGTAPPATASNESATAPGTAAASAGATVQARAENGGSQNVHIFAEGADTFGPHNRVMPGGSRTFAVPLPATGRVTFVAGRNGSALARKTWDGDPEHPERYPVVRFSEPNGLSITTGLR